MSVPDLVRELAQQGFDIPQSTLYGWEKKETSKEDASWNPSFIAALARVFDKTEIEILSDLGFPVIPAGFTSEDVEFAYALRAIPPSKRRRVLEALLRILELMDAD